MSLVLLAAIAWFLMILGIAVFGAWLAFSLGRWLGARESGRDDREDDGPVRSVVGATLALLAFTLAMTFNMAHTKHSNRKDLVRADVRAIQTAYDRAMLLPPEQTDLAHTLLTEYAQVRAFDTFEDSDVPLAKIISRSESIQHELWLQAIAHREHPQMRFYMDSLSAMTNTHAERITMGVHDRVPIPVWICLAFVTGLGMLTMGYQSALAGSRRTWATVPLVVAFCVVLCMALDLDRPQQGVLRVDQGPMLRLAQTLDRRSDE